MTVRPARTFHDGQPTQQDSVLPVLLIVAAVSFNAVLAIFNAHVKSIGAGPVIACEILIVGAAHLYAVSRFNRSMVPWYGFLVFAGVFAVLRMAAIGEIDVKHFRDILLIPTFVILGLATSEARLKQAFFAITAIVVGGVLLEAISLPLYSALLKIKDYYIATRGLVSADFTYDGDLYTSATRYQDRYLPFFGLHRLSSVFLEPVSLGNFAILMVAGTLAFWDRVSSRAKIALVAATILILFACDGRLAIITSIAIFAAAAVSRLAPPSSAVFILPLVVLAALFIVDVSYLYSGNDDFPGRLAYTVELIRQMTLIDYLGLSDRLLEKAVDSGIVNLIITQSVVLMVALWLLIVAGMAEAGSAQRNYKYALCLYLALNMMASYSFASIKTIAPFMFIYGGLAAAALTRGGPVSPIGAAPGQQPRNDPPDRIAREG